MRKSTKRVEHNVHCYGCRGIDACMAVYYTHNHDSSSFFLITLEKAHIGAIFEHRTAFCAWYGPGIITIIEVIVAGSHHIVLHSLVTVTLPQDV